MGGVVAVKIGFLTFLNTPFFLALSWFGSMVIFDQLVLVYSRFRIVFIFGFSLLTAAIFANAAAEGHLELGRWSLAETYFLAVMTHSIALTVLRVFIRDRRLRPGTQPPDSNQSKVTGRHTKRSR